MQYSSDSTRAALLLTNRLVALDAKPMTAREFWLLAKLTDPGELLDLDVAGIAARTEVSTDEATRLRTLLDAATALSFEQERLHDFGITLVSALEDRFPARLRNRLGEACPPFLLVAGQIDALDRPGLGVVGSDDADEIDRAVVRDIGKDVARRGWVVVSGMDRSVGEEAMDGAFDIGGVVVGVPPEGILNVSRQADIRRRVHAGELCLVSPYPPKARFRALHATGRTKILYALSQVTHVALTENGVGQTWGGAIEALAHGYGAVAAWAGDGATDGNHALIRRGATPITEPAQLFEPDTAVIRPPAEESLF